MTIFSKCFECDGNVVEYFKRLSADPLLSFHFGFRDHVSIAL